MCAIGWAMHWLFTHMKSPQKVCLITLTSRLMVPIPSAAQISIHLINLRLMLNPKEAACAIQKRSKICFRKKDHWVKRRVGPPPRTTEKQNGSSYLQRIKAKSQWQARMNGPRILTPSPRLIMRIHIGSAQFKYGANDL